MTSENGIISKLVVSFRGQRMELQLTIKTTVGAIKSHISDNVDPALHLVPSDIKLLFKGKKIDQDEEAILKILSDGKKTTSAYRLMATGASFLEIKQHQADFDMASEHAPRIRDDLSKQGQLEIAKRLRLGRAMMKKARKSPSSEYKFGNVNVLPNLPNVDRAREILTSLANDPGILACMERKKWKVGSLSELHPDGKVGHSAVCVMGLNKNKGQEILLRIRTDDLKGFRKILNIRKVLFHELAHNVYSEHDGKFFQLMREVERECNELDWTNGQGLTETKDDIGMREYSAGTHRLGGGTPDNVPVGELAARAALMRMNAEEEEIQQNCGCGQQSFLPSSLLEHNEEELNADVGMEIE
jgi:hypothetical protein